jgi:hypothetical protein
LIIDGDDSNDLSLYNGNCVANGFVKTVDSNGVIVRIELEDEPGENDYDLNGLYLANITMLKVNGVDTNENFNKAYAEGVITFSQTGKDSSKTTYRVEAVKGYNGSTKVRDIHFYNEKGEEFATDLGDNEVLTAGKEFTIKNTCTEEQIMSMTYTVERPNYAGSTVTVRHADYPDYFKTTGGDKLTVYANNARTESACNVNNKNAPVVTVTAFNEGQANAGYTHPSATDLQDGIVINGNTIS